MILTNGLIKLVDMRTTLEERLREKWKPYLKLIGKIPQEKVEEYKRDVQKVRK